MKKLLIIYTIFLSASACAQELTKEEKRMYHAMNFARLLHGKKRLPLNEKLNTVAKLHLENIIDSLPTNKGAIEHSWFSDPEGRWKEAVYYNNANADIRTGKAREITGYSSKIDSEILYLGKGAVKPIDAVKGWMKSKGHRSCMLDKWHNCGVSIVNGYASIYFGDGN